MQRHRLAVARLVVDQLMGAAKRAISRAVRRQAGSVDQAITRLRARMGVVRDRAPACSFLAHRVDQCGVDQLVDRATERCEQPENRGEAYFADAAFDAGYLDDGEAGFACEVFLRPAAGSASGADVAPEALCRSIHMLDRPSTCRFGPEPKR